MASEKEPPKRPPKKAPDPDRAARLSELIEDQGWEVAHLARSIGADPSRVYGWLKGETISSELLGELARALETTRRYLIKGEGPAHVPGSSAVGPQALIQAAERLKAETEQRG